jgi:peptidoglycan/xylan/chitin deacetylase (PgdA/CDA1 family)
MKKNENQNYFLNIASIVSCFLMLLFLFLGLVAIRFNSSFAIRPRPLRSPKISIDAKKTDLVILPSNSDILISLPTESLTSENISELLNDGHTSIQNNGEIRILPDTPLLLNAETIYAYVMNSLREDSVSVESSINQEIEMIYQRAQSMIPLAYLIATDQERSLMKDLYTKEISYENVSNSQRQVLHKLLNLTGEKTLYWELVELKNVIRTKEKTYSDQTNGSSFYTNTDDHTDYRQNVIFLEDNEIFYDQLYSTLTRLISQLEKMGLADDSHKELLEDISKILKKDESIYPKIFSMKLPYVLLHAVDDENLTVSTTLTKRQNTPINRNNFNEDLSIEPLPQAPNTIRLPVLMYHNIANSHIGASEFASSLYLSPESFEEQVAYLTKYNYKTIDSEEFYKILADGKNPEQKTIMLTFDDSTRSHYTQAFPILKKYRQKGTFFIVTNYSRISNVELKEMMSNGMDIQSHTKNHYILTSVRSEAVIRAELQDSREIIQNISGTPVTAIAYPGCVADQRVFRNMDGYNIGFSCGKSIDHSYDRRFMISRPLAPFNINEMDMILSGIYPHNN